MGTRHLVGLVLTACLLVSTVSAVRYVSPSGRTTSDCTNSATPCTLAYALTVVSGSNVAEEIELAAGAYGTVTFPTNIPPLSLTGVGETTIMADVQIQDVASQITFNNMLFSAAVSVSGSRVEFKYVLCRSPLNTHSVTLYIVILSTSKHRKQFCIS